TSRWRRNRPVLPPPEQNSQVRIPASDAPPKSPPKLEHRQSKMSLFNLFSRPKVERARGHHEPGLARKVYNVLQENIGSKLDITLSAEGDPDDKKSEKAKSSNKRLASSIVANTPELTTKIYVLVTSGYVLQYAGDGPFDRLPEKVLQLGKESAAFACDLIPGKHWVLQISQTAKEDGTVSMVPQKSFLSRLRLQNASARRTATSFLLVLESAEEMDSWLTAVRKEIDALGGMKCRPDSEPDSNDSGNPVEKQLQEKLGHRFLVQRDPNRFNNNTPVRSPDQSPVDSPTIAASDWERSR
ncbi:hypothetical protein K432DRAFT_274286, partial [Lepidopterella palustris CBS 459.81]